LEVLFRKKEMMMKRMILSLGVVAALAANTYGAGQVWYSATSTSASATVGSSGPGQTLELGCDKTPGAAVCTWDVSLMYTTADGGQTGWALDLFAPAGSAADFSVTNAVAVANVISAGGTTPGAPGVAFGGGIVDPRILWGDISGFNAAPPGGPGQYTLMTFTLTKGGLDGAVHNLTAWIGGGAFGGNDDPLTGAEIVQIGPNVPVDGSPTGIELPLPVITVTNIPEPATLSLLALGGIALIRRRK
jgi:hypothetical protein